MRLHRLLALALLALTLGTAPADRPIAVTGATVVTAPGSSPENATIVIRDGLIEAVGVKVEVPANARVIDATGLTVYAGFIDAGTSAWLPEFKEDKDARAAKESEPRDPKQQAFAATREANRKGVRAALRADEHVVFKDAKPSDGFTTALVVPGDAYFAGRAALVNLSGAPRRDAIVKTPLGLSMGFKASGEGYPANALGFMAHIRQTLLDAEHYSARWDHYVRNTRGTPRPPHDDDLYTIGGALKRRFPVYFAANSDIEIHRALDFADEFDLDVMILGGGESNEVVARLKSRDVPVLLTFKFDDEPKQHDTPERAFAEQRRRWEAKRNAAIALHEASVRFAFSADDVKEPLKNIATLVEAGLPRDAVLAALTTTPAKLLGVDDRLGTIEPGKIANLVALEGILGDKEARVRHAFVDGRHFEFEKKKEEKPEVDLTGTWALEITSERGTMEAELTLQQDGAKLTGSFSFEWGDGTIDGSVSGSTFEATAKIEGFELELSGELKDGVLSGSSSSEYGESTFKGTKKPESVLTPIVHDGDDVETNADRVPKTRTGGSALIANARLVTLGIDRGWVLIEDGKIAKTGNGDAPETTHVVIDAAGLTLIPGIIDAHAHIAASAINESSNSISAEVRIKDVLDPHDTAIYRAAAGGCTTANILHGSANTIGGQNAVIKMRWGVDPKELLLDGAPQGIKFALGENVKQSNWDKKGTRYPNTRMGVENLLRAAFTEAQAYKKSWEEYGTRKAAGDTAPPPRRDLRLEALVGILDGRILVHSHCYRADEILMLMRVAKEFGWRVKTFQHVLEGYKVAPEIARHGAGGSTFADWWAYKIEAFDAIPHNAAMMTRAGVVSSINSDSENHMRYLNLEAAKAMKYGGLSAEEALNLVTLNPAIQLAIDDRVGSVEPGKEADLALYNGHPLSPYSRCVMTLVDGEVVFEDRDVPNHASEKFDPDKRKRRPALPATVNEKGIYALTNVRIVPVTKKTIAKGTIVIADGRIAAVGAKVEIPEGATVIDLAGLSVFPGMIDAATQVGLTEIGSVAGTVDTAEIAEWNPELRASTAYNPHSELVAVARANGVTTVLTAPRNGQAAVVHLDGWTIEEALVDGAAGLVVRVPRIPADEKKADKKLDDLRKRFEEAAEYAKLELERDLKLEALVPYATGKRPVLFHANGRREIKAAVEFAVELKLKAVIVGGRESWKVADTLKQHDVPVILGPAMSNPSERYDEYDSAFYAASRLEKAGVRFCICTNDASDVRNLPYNAAVAAAYGLARAEALKAVTIRPAQILGLDDRLGSIEQGKVADLVVTTGDPLEIVTDVVMVFVNGKPVSLENKQTELYRKFRKRIPDWKR